MFKQNRLAHTHLIEFSRSVAAAAETMHLGSTRRHRHRRSGRRHAFYIEWQARRPFGACFSISPAAHVQKTASHRHTRLGGIASGPMYRFCANTFETSAAAAVASRLPHTHTHCCRTRRSIAHFSIKAHDNTSPCACFTTFSGCSSSAQCFRFSSWRASAGGSGYALLRHLTL